MNAAEQTHQHNHTGPSWGSSAERGGSVAFGEIARLSILNPMGSSPGGRIPYLAFLPLSAW